MTSFLVIADKPGDRQVALERTVALAQTMNCAVHCVAFVYVRGLQRSDAIDETQLEQIKRGVLDKRRAEMQAAIKELGCPGVEVTLEVVWSKDIATWVCAHCKEQPYVWVVKTGHGSGSTLHTSTDWQLLRECPLPVLIVAGKSWEKKPRVLAALDLGTKAASKRKLNERILEQARQLADTLHCELHAAYAIDVPDPLVEMKLIDEAEYLTAAKLKASEQMSAIRRGWDIPEFSFHTWEGPAERVIPRLASDLQIDIVVMGTVGRKGISGQLIGNTAEEVLATLRTDVLAVKL